MPPKQFTPSSVTSNQTLPTIQASGHLPVQVSVAVNLDSYGDSLARAIYEITTEIMDLRKWPK